MERTNDSKQLTVEPRLEKTALFVWFVCLVCLGALKQDMI